MENKTELEQWLEDTKAKNLSLERLISHIAMIKTTPSNIWGELEGFSSSEKAQILFNQWNAPEEEAEELPIVHYIDSVKDVEVWDWFCKNFDSKDCYGVDAMTRQSSFKFYGCFESGCTPKFVFDNIESIEKYLIIRLVKLTLNQFKEKYMNTKAKAEEWESKNGTVWAKDNTKNEIPKSEIEEMYKNILERKQVLTNEWKPKRGERVLVWNDNEDNEQELNFFCEENGRILVFFDDVEYYDYQNYKEKSFILIAYKHMKPLPKEEPTEKGFKEKVVEILNGRTKMYQDMKKESIEIQSYGAASEWQSRENEVSIILEQIKELN